MCQTFILDSKWTYSISSYINIFFRIYRKHFLFSFSAVSFLKVYNIVQQIIPIWWPATQPIVLKCPGGSTSILDELHMTSYQPRASCTPRGNTAAVCDLLCSQCVWPSYHVNAATNLKNPMSVLNNGLSFIDIVYFLISGSITMDPFYYVVAMTNNSWTEDVFFTQVSGYTDNWFC